MLTYLDISKKCGISVGVLRGRIISMGWSIEKATSKPVRKLLRNKELPTSTNSATIHP
jgi:hypothetical protein